jgi:hypothetical protein
MQIPPEVLTEGLEKIKHTMRSYKRNDAYAVDMSKDEVIRLTNTFYDNKKTVTWLDTNHEIKEKIQGSEKPWVYHYSLNINWVLFFTEYYLTFCIRYQSNEERNDFSPIYEKAEFLRMIFCHIDGIIEDGDNVYLIKDDAEFIKTKLEPLGF